MSDDKHLQIDLEFLDKDEPVQAKPAEPSKRPPSSPTKYNWKGILIGISVVIIIGIISDSSSDTSTSSSAPSPSENVIVGHYKCTSYDSSAARRLDPDQDNAKANALDRRKRALLVTSNELDAEKARLDAEDVDTSNQNDLDDYNERIDTYNAALQKFKTDSQIFSNDVDAYNASEKAHDDYLAQHCTPK
jgi:uncharacterized protein YeeX (DUF496 family)